jgi:hypothetical protein
MSVSPTNDALIVALDFEGEFSPFIVNCLVRSEGGQTIGVHSLERSAQEDTLLILFNTAISNLVRIRVTTRLLPLD